MSLSFSRIFLLLLPFILVTSVARPSEIPQWALITVFAPSLLLFFLVGRGLKEIVWTRLHTLISIWLLSLTLLATFHSETAGVLEGLLKQISLGLLFFVVSQVATTAEHRGRFIHVLLLAGFIASLVGLLQHFDQSALGFPSVGGHPSVFINKNYAAAFMDLVTPVALVMLLSARTTGQRWLLGLTAAICLGYTLATFSRGGWLALAVALTMFLLVLQFRPNLRAVFLSNKANQWATVSATLVALLLLFSPSYLFTEDTSGNMSDQMSKGGSNIARLALYQNSLAAISDHPLEGIGVGGFYVGYRDYYGHPSIILQTKETTGVGHAHQEYLHRLVEYGLPVGLLFILILGLLLYALFFYRHEGKASEEHEDARYVVAVLLGVTAVLAHGMVDVPLFYPVSSAYFWILAGMISPVVFSTARLSISVFSRVIYSVLALAALFVTVQFQSTQISGNLLANRAVKAVKMHQCDAAVPLANRAFDHAAQDYVVWNRFILVHGICMKDPLMRQISADLVLEKDAYHTLALLQRANARFEMKRLDAAFADYQQLAYLLPHRPSGHLGMANTLYRRGEIEASVEHFKRASELTRKLGRSWLDGPEPMRLSRYASQLTQSKKKQVMYPGSHP